MRGKSFIVGLSTLVAVAAACKEHLPDDGRGAIRGRVFYAGVAHADMAEPTLDVALFPRFPPSGPPVGVVSIPRPDFAEGAPFELHALPRYDGLYLLAELRDAALARGGPAAGAYPTFCALSAPAGPVSLTSTRTQDGLDITLYDSSGALDPCREVPIDPCPDPGNASLLLTLDAPNTATAAADALTFALFPGWPPMGPPARFATFAGPTLALPHLFIERAIAPGSYALYACYDVGGDNVTSLCRPPLDRLQILNGGALLAFPADTITTVALDLETGSSTITGAAPAGERCSNRPDAGVADAGAGDAGVAPSDAGMTSTKGTLAVTFTSTTLVADAADLLVVAVFPTPSPAGAPAGFTRVPATGFPQRVELGDLAPAPYYPFLCFDNNGDTLFCNGPGDTSAEYPDAPVTIEAGRTAEIQVAIDL